MKKLVQRLEQFMMETFGIQGTLHPWEKSAGLPQYLREHYRFLKMDVLENECVFVIATGRKLAFPLEPGIN
jgi:hypothetical protein